MTKEFLIGNKAGDLLQYTFTVTKPTSDKTMQVGDVVALLRQMSSSPPAENQALASQTVASLEKNNGKQGFPKSAVHTYIQILRQSATNILRNIHAANECSFEREYDRRLSLINTVLDDCNLMLKLVEISHDLSYINLARMEHWTKHISDVKYMTLAWRKKDTARAKDLRLKEQTAEYQKQADIFGRAVYNAILQAKNT